MPTKMRDATRSWLLDSLVVLLFARTRLFRNLFSRVIPELVVCTSSYRPSTATVGHGCRVDRSRRLAFPIIYRSCIPSYQQLDSPLSD
ncbi:hypothetical protein E4U41_007461, partial [Claviceps citrina]